MRNIKTNCYLSPYSACGIVDANAINRRIHMKNKEQEWMGWRGNIEVEQG